MAQQLPLIVWAIWLDDHIHTKVDGSLAVFVKRIHAVTWKRVYGTSQLRVRRMTMTSWG